MKILSWSVVFLSCFVFNLSLSPVWSALPEGFKDFKQAAPKALMDIRYYGNDNFVGKKIRGYNAAKCVLTDKAATALAQAQKEAQKRGFSLKVFDCYRPQKAVDHFVEWAKNLYDIKNKEVFYPNVDKKDLFKKGYIAQKSGHSRGSTVDLTLTSSDGEELDMGSVFDFFDPLSHTANPEVSKEAFQNRMLLKEIMEKAGFVNYAKEWWHYTLKEEPHSDTYFTFPID